jgi:hypothetical protein
VLSDDDMDALAESTLAAFEQVITA